MPIYNLRCFSFLVLVLLPFFFPLPAFATSWEGKTISQIDFEQNGVLLETSFIEMIDMKAYDLYQTNRVRQAIERLYATGRVQNVQVAILDLANNQLQVKWIVSQIQTVSGITLSGVYRFSKTEILDALHFVSSESLSETEWEKRQADLISFYKDEGYFNVQIKSQFQTLPENPSKTELLLHIEAGDRARIHRLNFTGTPVFPHTVLHLSVLSHYPEYFSMRRLKSDMNRLMRFYKKYGYRKAIVGPPIIVFLPLRHEVDVTLPITAGTKIDLFFQGVNRFTFPEGESLEKLIHIDQEHGDEGTGLEETARRIETFYHDEGYPFTKVTVKTKPFFDEDKTEASFIAENVIRTRIRKINFSGNNRFTAKRLRKLVLLKQEGLLRRTHFTKEKLREDAENLSLFYKKEGFLAAHVTPDISFDEKSKWATILFKIEEGIHTRIETISLDGAERISEQAMRNALSLAKGSPYNKTVLREGARQILSLYSRWGYLSAKVNSDVTFSEDGSLAQLIYKITEGEQVFLGSVGVTGNKKTKEYVLLREMAIQKGEPFDNEKILLSQQQLSRTGLFSSIHFEPVHNTEDKTWQDVGLTVVERPRLSVEPGFGYLDDEGWRFLLGGSHINLFGTGRKSSMRIEVGTIERRYNINYKEPRVFSYNADATVGVTYFKTQADSFQKYDEETLIDTVSVEKKLSSFWKSVLSYEYKNANISNVQPTAVLTNQDVGQLIIGSVNASLIRDARNDPFNPSRGSVHVMMLKTAAKTLASEVQLVKMNYQGRLFFPQNPDTTLVLSVRAGGGKKFGETDIIPLSERFFSGGRSTVRGYAQDSLGVLGETVNGTIPTGGNAMLILNEEIRIALYKSLGMVLFFDHGNVWREFNEIKLSEIKSTTGIGFWYTTPIGPLRVDWGYKLDREALDSSSEFHFTLGHSF